jgi:hypothetical protein
MPPPVELLGVRRLTGLQQFDKRRILVADKMEGAHERCIDPPAPNALDQPGSMLRQFVLDGVESGLGAQFVLVGGAAADADPADLHLVRCHDW